MLHDVSVIDAEGNAADELSFSYEGSELDDDDEEAESRQPMPAKVIRAVAGLPSRTSEMCMGSDSFPT